MWNNNELIEVALTVAIALAVGLTSASFGRDSTVTQSSCGKTQTQILIEEVIQALTPSEQEVNIPLRKHVEI